MNVTLGGQVFLLSLLIKGPLTYNGLRMSQKEGGAEHRDPETDSAP